MNLPELDKTHLWHPFTQMADWCAQGHQPLVIERGEGVYLFDTEGQCYLDGNSSIWTNIHGHNHPTINAGIRSQLEQLAHSSFLGTSNPPAIRLAEKLVALFPPDTLSRVFYSDNGSTAIECALKMAVQYHQLIGQPHRNAFIAFSGAYHGDTLGASALGGIDTFHGRFASLGLPVTHLENLAGLESVDGQNVAAVVIEPLVQGAAGIRTWPPGMLRELREWCDANGALLVLDEVMTGFGRTGKMFACEHEEITPDCIALAKGLTGGYLPLAATLCTEKIFAAFLGGPDETFYYGHSYCGTPLGCAAALANLQVFEDEQTLAGLDAKIAHLETALADLAASQPRISELRQCGMIAGIELSGGDGNLGAAVCSAARQHGLLTRPVLDTIVFMPPLSISTTQIDEALASIANAIDETCK